MEEKKIRILCCASDTAGVGHWRTIWPHEYIQEHYGDEFDIDFVMLADFPKDTLIDFLQQYDIIVFHKQFDRNQKVIDLIKFLSIPVVMDIDDYKLNPNHPLFMSQEKGKWWETIVAHLTKSDYVTTTTPIFANVIKKFNKNVYVLPNAVDKEFMPQFKQTKNKSDKIRFGLVCGSTHMKDIELMQGISTLPQEIRDKMQLVLCGVDYNGKITLWDKNTGAPTVKPIKPEQSVWMRYQEYLTNNYTTISPEHKKWLLECNKEDDPFEDESYRSFMTKNINKYAKHYENVDVLLAPLKEHDFNKMKSQLKAIEAAFTDTAIIASDFGPYQIDLKPYIEMGGVINPEGNALLVDESKNHKLWTKYITYIVNHPECLEVMKANLKKDICDKYSLENVTKKRVELYRKIYAEKHSNQ